MSTILMSNSKEKKLVQINIDSSIWVETVGNDLSRHYYYNLNQGEWSRRRGR